jgi:protein-arginine kinase
MLVENPVEFVHAKFANLCDHLERTYEFDTTEMRAVPATALYVLLKHHLLPHAQLVEAGNIDALVLEIKDADISALAMLCAEDERVLRYLKLFCKLVA